MTPLLMLMLLAPTAIIERPIPAGQRLLSSTLRRRSTAGSRSPTSSRAARRTRPTRLGTSPLKASQ